jgi:hypothetical protein
MASKRRLRRNACTGKRQHPDQTTAVGHIITAACVEGMPEAGRLASYRCRWCRQWHVGHVQAKYV